MELHRDDSFSRLSTNGISLRCRTAVEDLYRRWWPECRINSTNGSKLDRRRAIDTVVRLSSGAIITLQEKVRESKFLNDPEFQVRPPQPDFTQEYMNAFGTNSEERGEWFHLFAHYYLYAWEGEPGYLDEWVLLDVATYVSLVESRGDLDYLGVRRRNKKHGRASFYCIPISNLAPAVVKSSPGLRRFFGDVDTAFYDPPVSAKNKCIHEMPIEGCYLCAKGGVR